MAKHAKKMVMTKNAQKKTKSVKQAKSNALNRGAVCRRICSMRAMGNIGRRHRLRAKMARYAKSKTAFPNVKLQQDRSKCARKMRFCASIPIKQPTIRNALRRRAAARIGAKRRRNAPITNFVLVSKAPINALCVSPERRSAIVL